MALVHPKSQECTLGELDLFSLDQTQTSVTKKVDIEYRPVSSLTANTSVEFNVPGTEDYIHLPYTQLYVSGTIKHKDNTVLDALERIAPVNNFLHSLWRQVDVTFGSTQVSGSTNTYAHRAYLETVLNFGMGAKQSQLQTSMWFGDSAGGFEDSRVVLAGENKGFKERNKLVQESTPFEMIGPLFCDAFMMKKYLLSFVDLKIKLIPNTPEFCLISGEAGSDYLINLTSVALKVRKIKVAPHVTLGHEAALMKSPAYYPIRRTVCKSFTIPGTTPSLIKDNVFNGQIPKRVVLGMVKSSAVNGGYRTNPFNFDLFSMSSIGVYVDGEQAPGKPIKLKLTDTGGQFMEAYQTLFTGTGKFHSDQGNNITRNDYWQGYGLFVFDLSPEGCDSTDMIALKQKGNLSIEIVFSNALTEAINLFCYGEFDNIIEIDRQRNVLYDFTA